MPPREPVLVYATSDPLVSSLVQSLFDAEEIPYLTRGQSPERSRPAGQRVGQGPVEFWVPEPVVETARDVLKEIER